MSTEAQIEANRQNAEHSTGPVTADGKSVASQNAYRHGLRSKNSLAPGEDAAEYTAYALELIADLQPVGMAQRIFAEQIAQLQWKLRRVPEAEWVELESYRAKNIRAMQQATGKIKPPMPPGMLLAGNLARMMTLQVYETRIHRTIEQAHRQLRQLQRDAAAHAEAAKAASPTKPQPVITADTTPPAHAPTANPIAGQPLEANWVRSSGSPRGDSPPVSHAHPEASA